MFYVLQLIFTKNCILNLLQIVFCHLLQHFFFFSVNNRMGIDKLKHCLKIKTNNHSFALCLFFYIQVINTFTHETVDAEVRGKIISRIKTLILLSNRLETLLAGKNSLTCFSI